MRKEFERKWEIARKEIEDLGYIQANDIWDIYFMSDLIDFEDDEEAEQFKEFIEEKIAENFVLLTSDHQWLKQVLVANELATRGDLTFSFPDGDMAYYVTQENAEKYENLYEFLMKEDLIFDDELREKLDTLSHEYLYLLDLAYDSKQNKLFEMKILELLINECGYKGLHLGGARKPDGIIYIQKKKNIIME